MLCLQALNLFRRLPVGKAIFMAGFTCVAAVQNVYASPAEPTTKLKFPALAPPPPGEYIPRASDEKADYYLLSKTQTPEGLVTVSARKSAQGTQRMTYTKTLINCAAHQYKVLGYSAVSAEDTDNKTPQPHWSDIVRGTSKYEMVKMVCDKKD
jgi:hypothetical protein